MGKGREGDTLLREAQPARRKEVRRGVVGGCGGEARERVMVRGWGRRREGKG